MKLSTQKSRINFPQEKFVDKKDRENVLWAAWKNESRLILEKGMDYIQRSHLWM